MIKNVVICVSLFLNFALVVGMGEAKSPRSYSETSMVEIPRSAAAYNGPRSDANKAPCGYPAVFQR